MNTHNTETYEGYLPGSFGCHEALHLTSVILSVLNVHLTMHPAIQANPEWRNRVGEVEDMLAELYQEIGAAHL